MDRPQNLLKCTLKIFPAKAIRKAKEIRQLNISFLDPTLFYNRKIGKNI